MLDVSVFSCCLGSSAAEYNTLALEFPPYYMAARPPSKVCLSSSPHAGRLLNSERIDQRKKGKKFRLHCQRFEPTREIATRGS